MSSDHAKKYHKNSYKSIRSATCINCHRNPIGDLPINMPKKRQRIELKWLHKSGCKSISEDQKGRRYKRFTRYWGNAFTDITQRRRDLLVIGKMLLLSKWVVI